MLALVHQRIDEIKRSGQLPEGVQYTFDECDQLTLLIDDATRETGAGEPPEASTKVLKTTIRTVVTLKYGTISVREVVRTRKAPKESAPPLHSSRLAQLVAPGCRYGYDVVAHVGLESFLRGRRSDEIREDLERHWPSLRIPPSSLDELRRRFLFHLGQVHRHAVPPLREALDTGAGLTWLIDGTVEPGTPVFFGVQEARTAILLGCAKIPTENVDDMVPCLQDIEQAYGRPQRVLHDLSSTMSLACEAAFDQVPHDVCHFHFARDVGEDLLNSPQHMLTSRLRALKLQMRLREQRNTQTQWLREHAGAPEAELVLQRLLRGEESTVEWTGTLNREVLLAFHFWILDYAADGNRQGFPFDPYSLYLHRRLVKADEALGRLLAQPAVTALAPKALWNLRHQLERYCGDPQITTAAAHYEQAYHEFDRLRTILWLSSQGPSPMYDAYRLTTRQEQEMRDSLDPLCQEYRQRIEDGADDVERNICTIILTHIERYLPQLLPRDGNHDRCRTTNQLEGHWSDTKRACRHAQGRRKLTRTFHALPPELMLIPNLRKPEYISIVLDGNLDHLAEKFAEAHDGRSYTAWRRTNVSLNLGRIPTRILRDQDFVDHLLEVCAAQCQANNKEAA